MPSILIIDDDLMVREVVQAVLESAGFEVQAAAGGESGLRMLLDGAFDLLIVDLEMPGMGGRDIIKELRLRESSIPVVALTSFAWAALSDVLEMGVSRVYVKPFRTKELLEVVEGTLGKPG